jgi:rubrerythrin
MFSVIEILDLAIQLEKNGESVYRDAIEEVASADLVSSLAWMADEEAKHSEWLSELKKNIETKSINPFMEEMGRQVFGDLLGAKNFSHEKVDFSRVDRTADLIAIFVEFEKDTILFYETLVPFIQDAVTLDHLEKIIAEENSHIEKLCEFSADKTEVSLADD